MCDLDLEPCALYRESSHTAYKAHRCDCCGGPIAPGEKYRRHFSVYDGRATSEKACNACTMVIEAFAEEHGTHTSPSGMPDLLHNCVDYGDESARWAADLAAMEARSPARALPIGSD